MRLTAGVGMTIYSTQWCGYCHRLTRQLDREGVPYAYVDIEEDPAAAEFVMGVNGGNRTVPTVLFEDGVFEPSAVESSGTSTFASGK